MQPPPRQSWVGQKASAFLGGSTVTNTGSSVVNGYLGVSPGTEITGFPPGIVNGETHSADAVALQAQSDLTIAYNDLAGQACNFNLTGQDLGGMTLIPGVYCFDTSAQLTGALTLDPVGDPYAVWVFQIGSTLTTASNASVVVLGDFEVCNVFWQVGSSATIGTNTAFQGNIAALTSITLNTGATMSGRALARNGAVTMDTNTITLPVCTPTAVELLYFRANDLGEQQVHLEWATALEVDNFGFNLYRASANDRGQAALIHFEPAAVQGSEAGATYAYDDALPYDANWWYWLVDVDTFGKETTHVLSSTIVQSGLRGHLVFLPALH